MKRFHRLAVLGLTLLLAATSSAVLGGAMAIGEAAPSLTTKMKNIDGTEVSIADAAGSKGTLVLFTCNSCPWVVAWEERIVELGNTFSKLGIGVIAINSNDPEVKPDDDLDAMKVRAQERGMEFPYVMDETSGVARAFGATRTPEAFLLDDKGKVVYHGTIDDNAKDSSKVTKHYLKDAMEAIVEGDDVEIKKTKALGCTIKFRS